MNEKSKKSHSRYRKSPNDFAKTVIVFVVTAIIIIVGAIIAVNKPACNLVHKLEADMPIGIRDIEIDQSQNTLTPIDNEINSYDELKQVLINENTSRIFEYQRMMGL